MQKKIKKWSKLNCSLNSAFVSCAGCCGSKLHWRLVVIKQGIFFDFITVVSRNCSVTSSGVNSVLMLTWLYQPIYSLFIWIFNSIIYVRGRKKTFFFTSVSGGTHISSHSSSSFSWWLDCVDHSQWVTEAVLNYYTLKSLTNGFFFSLWGSLTDFADQPS